MKLVIEIALGSFIVKIAIKISILMIYRAIGIMSGSSLDGLDIAFVEFTETGGKWQYEILAVDCIKYESQWEFSLQCATTLSALDYQLLHSSYGHYIGKQINAFIERYGLQHKVHLIASHGHTTFHLPSLKMTAQLGCGAAIAATTQLPVVSDLRAMDIAFGGEGAPIVPKGEQLLFFGYKYFLNIGGIANISINDPLKYIGYDVCAANRVLNMLAADVGKKFDEGGNIAASGIINNALLTTLNTLDFYQKAFPKSLANSFGTDIIYPIIKNAGATVEDALRTYIEHICMQIKNAISKHPADNNEQILVTGGGAFNIFLIKRLSTLLAEIGIKIVVPDEKTVAYKEAIIMALLGVLRWREEANILPSVTGALRASIGGALWLGNEA